MTLEDVFWTYLSLLFVVVVFEVAVEDDGDGAADEDDGELCSALVLYPPL